MKHIKIKLPYKKNLKNFFYDLNLKFIFDQTINPSGLYSGEKKFLFGVNDGRLNPNPHPPDLKDLLFLYQFITLNKRTTVLEYGCGWTSLIIHLALMNNKKKYKKVFTRCGAPFNSYVVDNSKKYINICQKRIKKHSTDHKFVRYCFSHVRMTKFNNHFATEYTKHPLVNPDFIFLDGPSQFVGLKKKIDNFTVRHFSMMPMLCDILKFEHFLTPGTIILSDGRSANIRFLLSNFQRNWFHIYNEKQDANILYLDEKPLGVWNREQLNYYKDTR